MMQSISKFCLSDFYENISEFFQKISEIFERNSDFLHPNLRHFVGISPTFFEQCVAHGCIA